MELKWDCLIVAVQLWVIISQIPFTCLQSFYDCIVSKGQVSLNNEMFVPLIFQDLESAACISTVSTSGWAGYEWIEPETLQLEISHCLPGDF